MEEKMQYKMKKNMTEKKLDWKLCSRRNQKTVNFNSHETKIANTYNFNLFTRFMCTRTFFSLSLSPSFFFILFSFSRFLLVFSLSFALNNLLFPSSRYFLFFLLFRLVLSHSDFSCSIYNVSKYMYIFYISHFWWSDGVWFKMARFEQQFFSPSFKLFSLVFFVWFIRLFDDVHVIISLFLLS